MPFLLFLTALALAEDAQPAADAPPEVAPPEVAPEVPLDPAAPAPPPVDATSSFGQLLSMFHEGFDLSAYGDVVFTVNADTLNFTSTHFNPIIGAALHEDVYAEGEIEFEDGGTDVRLEYAYVDWTPSEFVSVRTGQFLVPIGDFNDQGHPSFRWDMVTRPSMGRSVIPAVWTDTGLQVMGAVESDNVRFDYAAYVINGLGARPGEDSVDGKFDATAVDPLLPLSANFDDNNRDKGLGGRARLSVHPGPAHLEVSASAYTGAASSDGGDRLTLVDVAWDFDVRTFGLRGEAAQSFDDGDPLERGMYAEVWGRIHKVTPAARVDVVRPLRNAAAETSLAASLMVAPRTYWTVRAEGQVSVVGEPRPTLSLMSAFFF